MVKPSSVLVVFALSLLWAADSPGQVHVPNSSFEEGAEWPTGWNVVGGMGAWEKSGHSGGRCISLSGDGVVSPKWESESFRVEPNKLYRLSAWIKAPAGQNPTVNVGVSEGSRRLCGFGREWTQCSFPFQLSGKPSASISFWTWCKRGKVFLDDVTIAEVKPVHATQGGIELGEGEEVKGGVYTAKGTASLATGVGGPGSRYLHSGGDGQFRCFNWYVHSQGVVFRHNVGGIEQTEASFKFRLGWLIAGKVLVLASRDGKSFEQLCELKKMGWTERIALPAKFFPAKDTYVCIRCVEDPERKGSPTFELLGYEYTAKLAAPTPDLVGKTEFAEIAK